MQKTYLFFLLAPFVFACNNSNQNKDVQEKITADTNIIISKPLDSLPKYTAEMLDSKKDFVCGMPVSAGIADTAHFKGKVYGFCSKECKEEFVEKPFKYLPKS